MAKLSTVKQAALDALAAAEGATWALDAGGDLAVRVGRRSVSVNVVELKARGASVERPRLRFDKVVVRLIAQLREAAAPATLADRTVVVTCTAPIKVASKTCAALASRIADMLTRRAPPDFDADVCGNAMRVRIIGARAPGGPPLVGFVHNPAPYAAALLLDVTEALVDALTKADAKWLLLANRDGPQAVALWRQALAAIGTVSSCERVLMSFADGRVEDLGAA